MVFTRAILQQGARLLLGATSGLLVACTNTHKLETPQTPLHAAQFMSLDIMPPLYELMTPAFSPNHRISLRPDLSAVSAQLTPDLGKLHYHILHDAYQRGEASWYGKDFHGRLTASGEPYNMNAMTAAHRSLPFGTEVCVRSLRTDKEVLVRINDRGPYSGHRIIDLSREAAKQLGMIKQGLKQVSLWIPKDGGPPCEPGSQRLLSADRPLSSDRG